MACWSSRIGRCRSGLINRRESKKFMDTTIVRVFCSAKRTTIEHVLAVEFELEMQILSCLFFTYAVKTFRNFSIFETEKFFLAAFPYVFVWGRLVSKGVAIARLLAIPILFIPPIFGQKTKPFDLVEQKHTAAGLQWPLCKWNSLKAMWRTCWRSDSTQKPVSFILVLVF